MQITNLPRGTLSRNEDKFNDVGCETITNLPRGTTAGIPTGETVIIVMVEPVWVASADWVFVFTDPNVAWKSLLLLLLRLLLLFTITLLTCAVCRTGQYRYHCFVLLIVNCMMSTWLKDMSMNAIKL